MEEFTELLTCNINDVIPILETIVEEEENRNIKYQLVVNSSAYAEDIFITITVEDADQMKKYELKRLGTYIGIKEIE